VRVRLRSRLRSAEDESKPFRGSGGGEDAAHGRRPGHG